MEAAEQPYRSGSSFRPEGSPTPSDVPSKEVQQKRAVQGTNTVVLDYKTHFFLSQIWEEKGGASYSPNVAYLAC